jgi:hypothetical protein
MVRRDPQSEFLQLYSHPAMDLFPSVPEEFGEVFCLDIISMWKYTAATASS